MISESTRKEIPKLQQTKSIAPLPEEKFFKTTGNVNLWMMKGRLLQFEVMFPQNTGALNRKGNCLRNIHKQMNHLKLVFL